MKQDCQAEIDRRRALEARKRKEKQNNEVFLAELDAYRENGRNFANRLLSDCYTAIHTAAGNGLLSIRHTIAETHRGGAFGIITKYAAVYMKKDLEERGYVVEIDIRYKDHIFGDRILDLVINW